MLLSYRFSLNVMASLVHGNHPLGCKKMTVHEGGLCANIVKVT